MRTNIAAGNWKMNLSADEATTLTQSISDIAIPEGVEVILGCPFPYLQKAVEISTSNSNVHISAQNCSAQTSGAFTGETSVLMLKSIGVTHVILGHSERRQYHNESDALILEKVNLCLEHELTPIYCCGEPLEIRESGTHISYVAQQLEDSILQLDQASISKIIIAYEPIWAIGTGKTASPEQAQEIQAEIRAMLANKYGSETAESISILYGGSVKPSNAQEIFSQKDVDGGLVGGASLKVDSFGAIIHSFSPA